MNTRFELNTKKLSIKGDSISVYVYWDNALVIKLTYADLEAAVGYLIRRCNLIPAEEIPMQLESKTVDSE